MSLDHEQRARDVRDVRLRRALGEEVVIALRIPEHELEVRLPRLGHSFDCGEEVIRAEHVDRAAPELRMARGQSQRHIPAVRPPHDSRARHVDALVVRKHLGHRVHVVEPVLPAPVAVDALRVRKAVTGRAAHVRDEHREAFEREDLDQRH